MKIRTTTAIVLFGAVPTIISGADDFEIEVKPQLVLNAVRSIDGFEEDYPNSMHAKAGATMMRMASTDYPDGEGRLMEVLPNARDISNIVSDNIAGNTKHATSGASDMTWIWGQFLDHDMGLSGEGGYETMNIVSSDCNVPEEMTEGEGTSGATMDGDTICMIPFTRSEYVLVDGVREQRNLITSYIDGSMVYGSDQVRADSLREFHHGRLKTSHHHLLPFNTNEMENAAPPNANATKFFIAGDIRANEQIGLTVMHTIFMREHNRLARLIRHEFHEADDDDIYQMARKCVGAEIQRITYTEFLPKLLGPMYTPQLNSTCFDPNLNPGIVNEFSSCAFRVGHTMLSSHFNTDPPIMLHDGFFNPKLIQGSNRDNIENLIEGYCANQAQEVDTLLIDDVRNFLFGVPEGKIGHDLASLNIQRGRDHGLPRYVALREDLKLPPIASFADITPDEEVQERLYEAYGSVENIDAWIGGLAEPHVPGGMVGLTFATIIYDQFHRSMCGDPFFYLWDSDLQDNEVLKEKVLDINNISLAQIIDFNTNLTMTDHDHPSVMSVLM